MKLSRYIVLIAGAALGTALGYNGSLQAQQPAPPTGPTNSQTSPGARPDVNTPSSLPAATATGDPTAGAGDRLFLHDAAEGGMAEVQFGQLAAQKSSSDDVKQFGQRMVNDHTQLNDALKPFIASKGVSVPKKLSKKDQAEYKKLSGLSGDAFDKEYVAMMVKDHHKDLKDFQTEANATADPQLKAVVQKGADVIQQHLSSIEEIARNKGVSSGASGQ